MSEKPDTDVKPAQPDAPKGPPKQALSGGGFEHAGSDEGGSAYGDDREDAPEPQAPEGGFKSASTDDGQPATVTEEKTFAAPDGQEGGREAATETVNNTGEPRPVKNREGVEGQPGDDVDAPSG